MSADPLALDRAARRSAQLVFDRPVVLEAGAGTGKTTALVGRLLAWTLGAGWAEVAADQPEADAETIAGALLDGVVAITFTDAAAAEMARRSQEELAKLAEGASLPAWLEPAAFPQTAARQTRARALLATVDRLRVQTIHSFAFALLRVHALDGRLHPALTVDADEAGLTEIVRATLAEHLPPLYRAADPALGLLARDGVGPQAIADALLEMSRRGLAATALAADPWTEAAIGAALDPGQAAARELATAVLRANFSARAKQTLALRDALPALLDRLADAPRTREGISALAHDLPMLWPESLGRRLDEWAKGTFNQTERGALGATEAIADGARRLRATLQLLAALDPDRLDAARALLAPLATEVERRMRARGLATYSDLLRLAVELLGIPAVARDARRGIRQLLVDELQDTDELQCELVRLLALAGPHGERPGLFLVGDPKQSIYGWRRARLANYFAFVEAALGGAAPGVLAANFRSAEGILAEVERVLAPVMTEESDVAARFAPLVATGERIGVPGEVEYWAAWDAATGKPLRAGESVRREAAAIAADLAERIARGLVAPRDAALLLRAATPIERYLEALRERGIPYAVEKDRSYYRRRETIDAAALVRAVLDPTDRPALVAWLRSPWVGVPDAALWPLFRAGLPERLGEAVLPDASEAPDTASAPHLAALDAAIARAAAETAELGSELAELAAWPAALGAAVRALLSRRAAFARESPEVWVDGLRRAFLPDLVAAARFQARHRLANLDRFFRELAQRLAGGEPHHRLLADLRAAARERPDEPESRPLDGSGEAVRVMTIHSAKGLEFSEVYLVAAHHDARGGRDRPQIEAERLSGRWEYRLFGHPTPGLAPAADLADRIRAAEQVRLLYVGLTRAQRRLVITGALPSAPAAVDPRRARTLAALLAGRLPGADLIAAAAADGGFRDDHGARWRLLPPVSASDWAEIRDAATSGYVATDALSALARLGAARAEARERAARVRVARATEVAELEALLPGGEGADDDRGDVDRRRSFALARGTALHRALELASEARSAPDRWRAAALATFERELGGSTPEERARLASDLERLSASALLARLEALAERVIARELPILFSPAIGDPAAPLDAVAGSIDLLYSAADGTPVVADFKSDAVASEAEGAALVARYAPQLALYAAACRQAFPGSPAPRRELWLLALDQVITLD